MKVDDPFYIRGLLSKSKIIADREDYNIAVKLTPEATRVLRNIGLDAPSPIEAFYSWPGKFRPLNHQIEMAEFHTMHKRSFNLSEMGAMKTASALWAADWMMLQRIVHKCLIISPLSTLERVWQQEIFDVLMHRRCAIVHGTRDERKQALACDVDFYILNHDGVRITEIRDIIRKRSDINLIIVDEGSKFRNADKEKYKSLRAMIREDQRLIWMTGTPCPTAPTDAWAQAKIICPTRVPQFFGAFKRQTMTQLTPFKWVPKPDAYKIAWNAMQPAIRFLKRDCIDLPPVVTEERKAPLSAEQKAAFKDMHNHMLMEYAENKKAGRTISAVNAADKVNKLRQILLGSIKDPATDEYMTLDHGPRLKVLVDTIEDASAKVLVVVPFKGIINALDEELKEIAKKDPRFTTAVLNGDVPTKARDVIIRRFKFEKEPNILLCHPTVMAHGLNLTEADFLIFYGPIYSNDEFQQVCERFNRAGQTRKMTIVRIGAHPIEWEIYRVVDTRGVTQNNILRLYEQIAEMR
jgi:SNF2 family DNA or RNA helicase